VSKNAKGPRWTCKSRRSNGTRERHGGQILRRWRIADKPSKKDGRVYAKRAFLRDNVLVLVWVNLMEHLAPIEILWEDIARGPLM
jgi:hypothetical protein